MPQNGGRSFVSGVTFYVLLANYTQPHSTQATRLGTRQHIFKLALWFYDVSCCLGSLQVDGQLDRQERNLVGQRQFIAGHCPMTGAYFLMLHMGIQIDLGGFPTGHRGTLM